MEYSLNYLRALIYGTFGSNLQNSFNQSVYSSIQILVQKYLAQYSLNINNFSAVGF